MLIDFKILEEYESYKRISVLHPHIAKKIYIFWGYIDCLEYMEMLLTDNDGTRVGFSMESFTLINDLLDFHRQTFPDITRPNDFWVQNKFI